MKRFPTLFAILLIFSISIHVGHVQNAVANEADWMPDANLRTAVRSALNLNNNDTLTQAGMANLTGLTARNAQISSLTGLEHATNLQKLDLRDNTISNISALSGLTNLESLKLKGNNISSVSALSGLTNLTLLNLKENNISSISTLSGLTNLEHLRVDANSITDVQPLTSLVNLERLWIAGNSLTNAHLLSSLTGLTQIDIPIPDPPDTTAPSVTVSVPSGTQNGTFDATITFSETVSGFTQSDVSLSGSAASITSWRANSGNTVYTATITPTASGTVTIGVAANVATDAANNQNTAATSKSVTVSVDTTSPDVTVSVPSGVQNGAFSATITFTESVSNFVQSDVSLRGSAASITSWRANSGNTVYTATITPTASGTVTIGVTANVATDAANNQNTAATSKTVSVDVDKPSVTIGVPSGTQTSAFNATITFTESVSNFVQSDVSLRGSAASITSWRANSSNTIYTATITLTASGTVTIGVAANVATDAANNANTAATSKTVTVNIPDPIPDPSTWMPDANLRTAVRSALSLGNNDTLTQAGMANLTRLTARNAQISSLTGLEHATNLTSLDLRDNTISNISALSGLTDLESLKLKGNNISSVSALSGLTNLTLLNLKENNISSISDLSGLTNLEHLRVDANSITDVQPLTSLVNLERLWIVGNSLTNAHLLSSLTGLTYIDIPIPDPPDTTAPSVTVSVPSGTQNGAFSVTITFTESVSNFVQSDVSLRGRAASITSWRANSGNTVYTATITPTASGTVAIGVAANVATDAANNSNTAATSKTVSIDVDKPTATIGVPSGTQTNAFNATITFSETVSGFTQSDVSLSGSAASITSWRANSGNTVYTATITATASGTVTIGVAANVATDAANNTNTAATSKTVTILTVTILVVQVQQVDTTSPGVSILVPSDTQMGAFDVTIEFTETVSGFVGSEVSLSGSAASITSWRANSDNTVYTATITPTASGTVTIGVAANVATDAANNQNTAATTQTVTVDLDPPSVTLTLLSEVEHNRIDVQITFNEPVEGFESTDLSITTNGLTQLTTTAPPPIVSITGWTPSQDKTTHTVYITTYTNTKGQVIINVPADVATDIAGNPNVAGSALSVDEEPELYLFISTVVDSSNGCPSYEGNEDGSIDSIDLRDYLDVNGDGSIDEDDVALVEAALGQFGDGIVNSRTDINCDNTVDNDDLALVDDTESPTFRISAPRDTQSGAFDIRIISSEPVFDFDGTDISLVDSTAMATATMKSFSYGDHDSTVTYSFTITPTTSGDLVISIPAGAAKDALDNQNTASAKHTVTVDMSIPSVSITSTRVEPSVFKTSLSAKRFRVLNRQT